LKFSLTTSQDIKSSCLKCLEEGRTSRKVSFIGGTNGRSLPSVSEVERIHIDDG